MSRSNAEREREMIRRIRAVVGCKSTRFKDILEAAEIDPKTGLRFRNLAGLSFAGQDLRGMDFTGANLCGCDVSNALIEGARFDRARLGRMPFPLEHEAGETMPASLVLNLRTAKDWPSYADKSLPPAKLSVFDDYLPVGGVFYDSHVTQELVVLPRFGAWSGGSGYSNAPIAISRYSIGSYAIEYFREARPTREIEEDFQVMDNILGKKFSFELEGYVPQKYVISRRQAEILCKSASAATGKKYRLPTLCELEYACSINFSRCHFWSDEPNVFGVWLKDEHDRRLHDTLSNLDIFSVTAVGSTPRICYEWCSDSEMPVEVVSDGSVGRTLEVRRPSREISEREAGFHIVREMEYSAKK